MPARLRSILAGLLLLTAPTVRAQWTHMGPFKQPGSLFITGRANVICPTPFYDGTDNQTIYLGSVMGGFWKTVDDGLNWSNIHPDPAVVKYGGVSALAVTPDEATVYVGDICFQYGSSGVYKYSVGPQTWTATGALPGFSYLWATIHDICIHPANAQIVFACTTSGLYRSANGGTSWTQITTNDIETVKFVPSPSGTSGTYPYLVFASGENEFSKSTDDGVTFSMVTSMTSLWSSFTRMHPQMSYTIGAASGQHYLYLFGRVESASPVTVDYGTNQTVCYGVYRYSYDQNTLAEASQKVILYTGGDDYQTDRLTVGGYKNVVYFGGTGLYKYNMNTNLLYMPNSPGDAATASIGYATAGLHADNHDIAILPAINRILLVNDGGFAMDNYTPGAQDVFNNSWSIRNNGLHIAQTLSFSGAADDPDLFSDNDVDNGVMFINDNGTTIRTPASNEAPASLIDKYNSDNIWYRVSAYVTDVRYSDDLCVTPSSTQTLWEIGSPTDFCDNTSTWSLNAHEFSLNSLFQDPNRPGHVFYGTSDLGEFCFSDKAFHWKYRPSVALSGLDWNQTVVGMAFSRLSKNDTWLSIKNGATGYAQVLQFTDPDIDDSWVTHNENGWTAITPNWGTIVPALPPTVDPQKIWYPGIVASDWTPNRLWAICSVWPSYPATDMPVKVLHYENGNWKDMSAGIPVDESPTAIVYEQGSHDHLYLGTNRSIYYYNYATSHWVDMSDGQAPHIMVSEMQINYTENTLRVGLKGRGVWKHDLICPTNVDITLTGTYTTDNFYEVAHQISATAYLQTSGDVTMRAGEIIEFTPGASYTQIVGSASNTLLAYIHGCSTPGNTWRHTNEADENFLEDESEESDLEAVVYPNPSNGKFTLEKEEDDDATITVYDVYGRQILAQQQMHDRKMDFDLSEQPVGIYFVRMVCGTEIKTIRVVKQ